MNSAFLFAAAVPTSAAFMLSGLNLAGARPAADAGVFVVIKPVVGQIVFDDVAPHVRPGPFGQGMNLRQLMAFVPFDDFDGSARSRLIAAQSRQPGVKSAQRALQWFHFANAAS